MSVAYRYCHVAVRLLDTGHGEFDAVVSYESSVDELRLALSPQPGY